MNTIEAIGYFLEGYFHYWNEKTGGFTETELSTTKWKRLTKKAKRQMEKLDKLFNQKQAI
jgi:hypothetical protein